jgi:hypothetical protein
MMSQFITSTRYRATRRKVIRLRLLELRLVEFLPVGAELVGQCGFENETAVSEERQDAVSRQGKCMRRKLLCVMEPRPKLDEAQLKNHADYGAMLLKTFHYEYERDPIGRVTEFRRGQVTGWRHLLDFIYGRRTTELIV